MTSSRRGFLGTLVAAGALAAAPGVAATPTPSDAVRRLIDASRDREGRPHVERAALIGASGVEGTLPLGADERDDLLRTLEAGDFSRWQLHGVRVDGRKFVFIKHDVDEGDVVVHAVRPGEFLTVRVAEDRVVLATSGPGMVHGRAVDAVYRFCRRPRVA